MIKINLLGDSLAQTGKKADKAEPVQVYAQGEGAPRSSLPIAGLVVGLLFAACGGVYYIYLNREVAKSEARRDELARTKKELDKYLQLEQTFKEQKESLAKKKEVMVGLRIQQHLPVHFLEELANCTPDDVWFKEISQKDAVITVKGEGGSFEAVNQFRTRLQEQKKWFGNIVYPGATKKASVWEFSVSFELKKP